MAKKDQYGNKGSKQDYRSATTAHIGGRPAVGAHNKVNRSDGTSVVYRETPAGPRQVPGTDTSKG